MITPNMEEPDLFTSVNAFWTVWSGATTESKDINSKDIMNFLMNKRTVTVELVARSTRKEIRWSVTYPILKCARKWRVGCLITGEYRSMPDGPAHVDHGFQKLLLEHWLACKSWQYHKLVLFQITEDYKKRL